MAEQKEEIHVGLWGHPWVTQLTNKGPLFSKYILWDNEFLIFQKSPLVRYSVACSFVNSLIFSSKREHVLRMCNIEFESLKHISTFTYSFPPFSSPFPPPSLSYWTQKRPRRHRTGCKKTSPILRLSLSSWLKDKYKLTVVGSFFTEDMFCPRSYLVTPVNKLLGPCLISSTDILRHVCYPSYSSGIWGEP